MLIRKEDLTKDHVTGDFSLFVSDGSGQAKKEIYSQIVLLNEDRNYSKPSVSVLVVDVEDDEEVRAVLDIIRGLVADDDLFLKGVQIKIED